MSTLSVVNDKRVSEGVITEDSKIGGDLMNAVAAAIGTRTPIQGAEDRIHQNPEFYSARFDNETKAYRVVVETSYSAGPAVGKMTLSCWVHDEESEWIPGVKRVSDLREDPMVEFS